MGLDKLTPSPSLVPSAVGSLEDGSQNPNY